MAKNFVKAVQLREYDAAALSGVLDPISDIPLEGACFLIRIVNNSNTTIQISYDGVVGHDVILPNTALQLDFQTNASPSNYQALLRKGALVWVVSESGLAGVGTIYLIGYYQEP